jgi:hypothetical protein
MSWTDTVQMKKYEWPINTWKWSLSLVIKEMKWIFHENEILTDISYHLVKMGIISM